MLEATARRQHGDDDPDHEGEDDRARSDHHVGGQVEVEGAEQRVEPVREASAEEKPMIDAIRPMTSASRSTARRICFREAPIVRSVASSRVRCATVIDIVLKMTKAPTNRATAPKASEK